MTIYLTSSGAVGQVRRGKARPETAAGVGPGHAFSIMRNPRPQYGEVLDGRVLAFTPPQALLGPAMEARAAGRLDEAWDAYERGLRAIWERPEHQRRILPGRLGYGRPAGDHEVHDPDRASWDGGWWIPVGFVADGDTLTCGCGAEAARAGRCHRVIAADILRGAGWDVVLDGRALDVP